MASTHFSSLQGRVRTASGAVAQPTGAKSGDVWFDTTNNAFLVYDGSAWRGAVMTSTSTSTSTSTTISTSTTTS